MAKTPNGLGQFSGKVGGVVFAVSNGQQTVRQYQPVVRNPKSAAQMLQRAKANLVGRLSGLVPASAIVGLGSSDRQRRARFLSNGLRLTNASIINGEYTAKLHYYDVQFSRGNYPFPFHSVSARIVDTNVVVNIRRNIPISPDEWERLGLSVVLLFFNQSTSSFDWCQVESFELGEYPETGGVDISRSFPINSSRLLFNGYDCFAYLNTYRLSDEGLRVRSSFLGSDNDDIAAFLLQSSSSTVAEFSNSFPLVASPASGAKDADATSSDDKNVSASKKSKN